MVRIVYLTPGALNEKDRTGILVATHPDLRAPSWADCGPHPFQPRMSQISKETMLFSFSILSLSTSAL